VVLVYDLLVSQTNLYASQKKIRFWQDVDVADRIRIARGTPYRFVLKLRRTDIKSMKNWYRCLTEGCTMPDVLNSAVSVRVRIFFAVLLHLHACGCLLETVQMAWVCCMRSTLCARNSTPKCFCHVFCKTWTIVIKFGG